ncbi:LacI family DNA-binding transcriptional regulator [Cryobacterium melibiosiphilum]|uniref:LacI family DNA-binding transcriptional regulator n=1 Tax=Cryobacterium melibiosiphilum TaxID=995039 RepID=UPI0013147DEE|nr:LacI family DNA-binding transcriptional regulator [Cryobacterium melibiosiphilum]
MSRITSHDVAREAQVSQATVSRALRGDPQISAATIERVTAASERLGYVPSSVGRSLSRRATGQIAVVTELGNLTYPDTIPAMHDELHNRGYGMLLISEHPTRDSDHAILFDGSVDGVILTTSHQNSELPARLQKRNIPFVFLNRTTRGIEADSVTADNAGGARSIAQLLLGDGHTNIAMLAGPSDLSSAADRERGFTTALRKDGIEALMRPVVRGDLTYEAGRLGWAQLVSMRNRPTAVFCSADAVAIGLLNAIAEQGERAHRPAVIGFDNSPISGWPVFSLTTVDTHLAEMARLASALLVERIEQLSHGIIPPVRRLLVPTTVVLRTSHVPA